MYKRPSPGESDEDILRLQREFNLKQSAGDFKLAATVVSNKKEDSPETIEDEIIQDQVANTFETIPTHANLGHIVENSKVTVHPTVLNFNPTRGFPAAKRRDIKLESSASSRGSIFSRQYKKAKTGEEISETKPSPTLPSQSFVVANEFKNEIHLENVNKLKSMSETEIMEEREKLIATMDPAIVAFLKERRKKVESENTTKQTIQEQNEAAENMDVEEVETVNEILKQSETWLNFKTVENAKLAWMRSVETLKIPKDKSYEARFDFEGWLLPYEEEITEKSRMLYHHGEEAGRPGYTLQELFQLSRSNVIQQKIVALNSIANLLELNSTGVYEDIIDLPLEQIFFVLRFCLDDNTPAVLNASIKAMRNLFYSKVDETCLDSLLGFGLGQIQPTLQIDNDPEDDNRVNDQQLAEINLVKCVVRTGIVARIRYVINTVKPPIETIAYCMDILTRLTRDSQFIFMKVYKCESLLTSIVTNFIPKILATPSSTNLPLLQSIKFLRILSTRSRTIASDLIVNYNIMDSIVSYLSNEVFSSNTNGIRLQTECFHLWSIFNHYSLAFEFIKVLEPVLIKLLNYHFENTNLDSATYIRQGHVASLLVLLSNCNLTPFWPILTKCAFKWCKQFMSLSQFSCGKLQIISSMFKLMTLHSNEFDSLVLELLNSPGFQLITSTIKNGSMLLNNYETHKTSANLKSVEAAAWNTAEHVIPLMQNNSPLPFLSALSFYITNSEDKKLKLAFLAYLTNYLDGLRGLGRFFLTNNWFTRIESNLIVNVLKCSVALKNDLDTRNFYELCIKCLHIYMEEFKPDIEFMLEKIIFSRDFYPSEVLMGNLQIEKRSDSLMTSLEHLNEIREVYISVLGLKSGLPNFTTSLSLEVNKENVIPIDWIYTPIILFYSNHQDNKRPTVEGQQEFIIKNCLRWILIYETYFPELASDINTTDRFCRIACTFLGSDNLFLIEEIHNLLSLCLKNILKNENKINFNRAIEGLSSFQDFYTQLLEQYQGVSYGDVLFGNFILVALSQRHPVKLRKILWSEYMGVVETFNVTPEQCICPLEVFLEPAEQDVSLLKCYHRAIVTQAVRKHSILYIIAKHHVEKHINKKK